MKILILLTITTIIFGCETTTNFSASSKGDVDELRAPCVGPLGVFYINNQGKPIIQVSPRRISGNTEIFFSKHDSIKENISWPHEINILIDGSISKIEESGELGVNVLQKEMAYYKYPHIPQIFTIDFGAVYLGTEKIELKPIKFTYETRRFLMCVQ